jgi:hypothetical protein
MGGGGMAQRNDGVLEPLRRQLFDSDLSKMIADFPSWKINGYKDMHDKFMKRRVEFLPKEPIKLVN